MAIEEKQLEATEKPESRIEDLLVQVIDMIKSGGSSTEGTQFEPPPQSRDEEILYATLQGQPYTNKPESRIEDLYIQLKEAIETSSGATLIEKSITANGTYSASDDDADGYSSVSVDVPNTYTAGDEGKVVSNGALVAQTAYPTTITENGTYNTTENDSVTVNVSSSSASGCAELYDSNTFTTKVRLCLSITKGIAILSGIKGVGSSETNYYIDPNDLILSDFFNVNEKIITGFGRGEGSSVGIYTMQCTLHIAQNYISIKTTASVAGTPKFYIYLDTQ